MTTNELDEIGNRYTSALAAAMANTRQILVSQILQQNSWGIYTPNDYEIEVDFDGKAISNADGNGND